MKDNINTEEKTCSNHVREANVVSANAEQKNNSAVQKKPVRISVEQCAKLIGWPANVLINGITNSGKTYLFTKLVRYCKKEFDFIFAFGDDVKSLTWVHPNRRFTEPDILVINRIQLLAAQSKKKVLIILDDVLGRRYSSNCNEGLKWDQFVSSCRHSNVSLIISIQKFSGVSTTMRNNTRLIVSMDLDNQSLEAIYPYCYVDTKADLKNMRSEMKKYDCFYQIRGKQDNQYGVLSG